MTKFLKPAARRRPKKGLLPKPLPDAVLSADSMKEIYALHSITDSNLVPELESDLKSFVLRNRGLLQARLDQKFRDEVKEILGHLSDAAASVEVVRTNIPAIESTFYTRLLQAYFGSAHVGSIKTKHAQLDLNLKAVSNDLLALTVALSHVTAVKLKNAAHRPKSPHLSAAIELAAIWKKHTGKLPASKAQTMKVKGEKRVLNNLSDAARFMQFGLRLINPNISGSEARTATRYAVTVMKKTVKPTPPTGKPNYSGLLEGRLKTTSGKILLRQNLRRTITRKKPG